MSDRTIPYNEEAEVAVLGAVLIFNDLIDDIAIDENHFWLDKHRVIFRAMWSLRRSGESVDEVTVFNYLKQHQLTDVVPASDLAFLSNRVPSAVNAPHYAKIVRENAVRRSIIQNASELISAATNGHEVGELERKIGGLSRTVEDTSGCSDALSSVESMKLFLKDLEDETPANLETGFFEIDSRGCDPPKEGMCCVGAYTKVGKTTFCVSWADNLSQRGIPTLYITTEEKDLPISQRRIAKRAGVSITRLRKKQIGGDEMSRCIKVAGELTQEPLYTASMVGRPVEEISRLIRREVREKGIQMVFVDHVLRIPGRGKTRERINHTALSLNNTANECGICLAAAAQLNRYHECMKIAGKVPPAPGPDALKETGLLQEEATVLYLLHRPGRYSNTENPRTFQVNVAANRFGSTGLVDLEWILPGPTVKDIQTNW